MDSLRESTKEEQDFTAVNLAATMELQQFGEALAVHIQSYAELEKIAGRRINPDPKWAANNYHQQAGYSAEVKHVAKTNAENIIAGQRDRIARTDNVGYHNHQQYDFTDVKKSTGMPSTDTDGALLAGDQMKVFKKIGSYDKLFKSEYEHYRDAELVIPYDHFEQAMAHWDTEQAKLEQQRDVLLRRGQPEEAARRQQQIDQIKDARSRARASPVSAEDAMEARKSPLSSVGKDVLSVSHRAGLSAAKSGAVLGGGLSVLRNIVHVSRSGKSMEDATVDVLTDTGKAAAGAYATAALSSAVSGVLQSTGSQVMQNLGRSNAPAMAVQAAGLLAKSALALAQGELQPEDFVRHVTKEGATLAVSITGSNLGAIAGTVILPGIGTVVGGLIGGMVVSMLGGRLHTELMQSVAALDASDARRLRTQAVCAHLIRQHEAYRQEMHLVFDHFFAEKRQELKSGFDLISSASINGESIQDGLALIARAMNKQLAFESQEAFTRHIQSNATLSF